MRLQTLSLAALSVFMIAPGGKPLDIRDDLAAGYTEVYNATKSGNRNAAETATHSLSKRLNEKASQADKTNAEAVKKDILKNNDEKKKAFGEAVKGTGKSKGKQASSSKENDDGYTSSSPSKKSTSRGASKNTTGEMPAQNAGPGVSTVTFGTKKSE